MLSFTFTVLLSLSKTQFAVLKFSVSLVQFCHSRSCSQTQPPLGLPRRRGVADIPAVILWFAEVRVLARKSSRHPPSPPRAPSPFRQVAARCGLPTPYQRRRCRRSPATLPSKSSNANSLTLILYFVLLVKFSFGLQFWCGSDALKQ